jgi:hypothetical protein
MMHAWLPAVLLNLSMGGGEIEDVQPVAGPYRLAAAQVRTGGAVAGQTLHRAAKGQVGGGGAAAGQIKGQP